MADMLFDREIEVWIGGQPVKTIKRHVKRTNIYKPTHGTVEVQKRQWVKVKAISPGIGPVPFPTWQLMVEECPWLDADATFKK